jgi:hypothetical protein
MASTGWTVDPGIARARTSAEHDEQERQCDRAEQRHVAETSQQGALEVHQAHGGHSDRAADHSLGEPRVEGEVANRVTQADHRGQTDPAQHVDQGKHEGIRGRSPPSGPQVHEIKAGQKQHRGKPEIPPELIGPANDQRPLQRGELSRGQEGDLRVCARGGAPVLRSTLRQARPKGRQAATRLEVLLAHAQHRERPDALQVPVNPRGRIGADRVGGDPLRHEPAFRGIGQDRLQGGQQVFGTGHVAQIDDAPGGDRLANAGEAGGLGLIHEQEPEARYQRRGDKRDELQVARRNSLCGPGGGGAFNRGTTDYPHREVLSACTQS